MGRNEENCRVGGQEAEEGLMSDKWPERESSVQLKRSLKRMMPFKTDIKEKKRINC